MKPMKRTRSLPLCLAAGMSSTLGACGTENVAATESAATVVNTGSYNLHLEESLRFEAIPPGADPDHGRRLFGLAADLETENKSEALFQGFSQAFGGVVVSNQRTCFTCHRGRSTNLGFPATPLSAHVPADDALFTGIDADAQGDPDKLHNLDQLALIKYRPGRFNLARPEEDAFRKVFFWRKSVRLVNTAFQRGFLNDGRARVMFETDRGAVFSHTQESDNRFDDLFSAQNGADMQAFQFGAATLSDPRLDALRDPANPLHDVLANDPFYTVSTTTAAQRAGQKAFVKYCMTCHNTPNVFNNLSNVEATGAFRPETNPAFAPGVGRAFNIGVSERNKHHLRFTHYNAADGTFSPIVIQLANEDGSINNYTIAIDIGLAAVTARTEDIGRFKVPQLRKIKDLGPYFHDNSADTLEDVVDYFNGPDYNGSKDGSLFPIHMTAQERSDLLAFLRAL